MRWIDVIRISLRMLRTNLSRSFLTTLAIVTAIALIVILVGLGYGLQNITIGSLVSSQSLLSLDVSPGKDGQPPLDDAALKRFRAYPGVQDVSPVFSAEGQLSYGGKLISNAMEAGDASLLGMLGVKEGQGRGFKDGAQEILVSPQAASLLGVSPDSLVGKQVEVAFVNPLTQQRQALPQPLTVVGVTAADTTLLLIPYSAVAGLPNVQMTGAKVVGGDRTGVVEAQDALRSQGYGVDSLIDTLDSARRVFQWVTIGLVVISAIALVVAAIGMFNTLTIALLERTREIGIMKAIGITDRTVMRLFLTEAMVIGFLGGLGGVLAGTLTADLLGWLVNRVATYYGGQPQLLFQYPPFFLVSVLVYPVLLSLLTGLYPAIRASRISSLVALRYE